MSVDTQRGGVQWTGQRFVAALIWSDWLVAVVPWIQRGHKDGTIICIGPFRWGWR